MLNEVCPYFAVMETLAQTTESEIQVGKYRAISFLNDELVEEREAARKRVVVSLITIGTFCDR